METTTHTLNERLKRIEPTSKKCSYCVNGQVEKLNSCYFVPIFKENDRTNIVVYRSVKYQTIKIGIPRCIDCFGVHEQSKNKALILSIFISIAIFAFGVYNFLNFPALVSVIIFVGAIAAGFGGYIYLQNNFARKQEIGRAHV